MSQANDQAVALAETAGARRRDDLKVFTLSGDDQRSWLNGQVTCDVRTLAGEQTAYGLVLTVKGRILSDAWVMCLGNDLAVVLPESAAETVLERFDAQIIMEDVEIAASDLVVLSVQGPRSAEVVGRAAGYSQVRPATELNTMGHLVLCAPEASDRVVDALTAELEAVGGLWVDDAGWELARQRAHRPAFGPDFGLSSYPQEAGLKERAVSFEKGCYLGQEVVCTLENRGRLNRELYALKASKPLSPEAPLCLDDGQQVGVLTSCIEDSAAGAWLGLGYVKRAHADAKTLKCGESDVQVVGAVSSL